jgi:hypothetical protein
MRSRTVADEFRDYAVVAFVAILALAVAAFFWPARAHDTGKGWSYPWECCADNDCAAIAADRVRPAPGGYIIDGKFHVAQAEVRHSPDGAYHACFPKPDVLKCFWAPPSGS